MYQAVSQTGGYDEASLKAQYPNFPKQVYTHALSLQKNLNLLKERFEHDLNEVKIPSEIECTEAAVFFDEAKNRLLFLKEICTKLFNTLEALPSILKSKKTIILKHFPELQAQWDLLDDQNSATNGIHVILNTLKAPLPESSTFKVMLSILHLDQLNQDEQTKCVTNFYVNRTSITLITKLIISCRLFQSHFFKNSSSQSQKEQIKTLFTDLYDEITHSCNFEKYSLQEDFSKIVSCFCEENFNSLYSCVAKEKLKKIILNLNSFDFNVLLVEQARLPENWLDDDMLKNIFQKWNQKIKLSVAAYRNQIASLQNIVFKLEFIKKMDVAVLQKSDLEPLSNEVELQNLYGTHDDLLVQMIQKVKLDNTKLTAIAQNSTSPSVLSALVDCAPKNFDFNVLLERKNFPEDWFDKNKAQNIFDKWGGIKLSQDFRTLA